MGDTYDWVSGSGKFEDPDNWIDATAGNGPPAGPPGSSDTAILEHFSSADTVSGSGDVEQLEIEGEYTFTGEITAEDNISFNFDSDFDIAYISAATLTGKKEVDLFSGTVEIKDGGALISSTSSASPGLISNVGSISVSDGGQIQSYSLFDGGALSVTDGQIAVTTLRIGDEPGLPTSIDIDNGGTVTDGDADIGTGPEDISSATVGSGGLWINTSELNVGIGDTSATLDIQSGGSVSILGDVPFPTSPALSVAVAGPGSIDVAGVLNVTGDRRCRRHRRRHAIGREWRVGNSVGHTAGGCARGRDGYRHRHRERCRSAPQ